MRLLGRLIAPDGRVREVEVVAAGHGTAKIRIKAELRPDERLLSVRVVQE